MPVVMDAKTLDLSFQKITIWPVYMKFFVFFSVVSSKGHVTLCDILNLAALLLIEHGGEQFLP